MPRRRSPHPTEAELEVLNVLWRRGPSTVREVHEVLQADRTTAMTTTLKILQVMAEKGLVVVDKSGYPHRYSAAVPERKTQSGLVKDLAHKAFSGSVQKLLMRAVEDGGLSPKELAEIRKAIDAIHRGRGGGKP